MREKEEVSRDLQKYFKHNRNVPKFKMINEEQYLEIRNRNKISHACNSTEAVGLRGMAQHSVLPG
jgi:hypothetical protein